MTLKRVCVDGGWWWRWTGKAKAGAGAGVRALDWGEQPCGRWEGERGGGGSVGGGKAAHSQRSRLLEPPRKVERGALWAEALQPLWGSDSCRGVRPSDTLPCPAAGGMLRGVVKRPTRAGSHALD